METRGLSSRLLRGNYLGDNIREDYRVMKGDTRSVDYSSWV